jgi:hypothetical protein
MAASGQTDAVAVLRALDAAALSLDLGHEWVHTLASVGALTALDCDGFVSALGMCDHIRDDRLR